jgi:hypothetical protein
LPCVLVAHVDLTYSHGSVARLIGLTQWPHFLAPFTDGAYDADFISRPYAPYAPAALARFMSPFGDRFVVYSVPVNRLL